MSHNADIDQAQTFGDEPILAPKADGSYVKSLARLSTLVKLARGRLVDFVLPPRCATCRGQTTTTGAVCAQCWRHIEFIEAPFCARLGTPFLDGQLADDDKYLSDLPSNFLSAEAIARPPVFDRARAVALYDGPVRKLVTTLKFGDRTDHAPLMGRWMARAGAELIKDADLIAPVPLHSRRLFWRKHNQSALLANAIASIAKSEAGKDTACDKIVVPDLLLRTRPTRAQIGLNARQRAANVKGALKVANRHRDKISGRRILLIDDVYTTGATVNAASKALLAGGAGAVDVLTFARVVSATQLPI